MRTLKTREAAALLSVSPNTLRAWERRFGYPTPLRSAGKHRTYAHAEVAALRDALQDGLSISSAISRARESLRADTQVLVGALSSYETERADAAMETALAMRSVERAVEDVLLPSLAELQRRHGADSAAWALGMRWAVEWLRRAQWLAPAPQRPGVFLIGDATAGELDVDRAAQRAFELFLVRAGVHVSTLPVGALTGLRDALAALKPDAAVIVGAHAEDDAVARWAYGVRSAAGALPIAVHRRGVPNGGGLVLEDSPTEASVQALDLLHAPQALEVAS